MGGVRTGGGANGSPSSGSMLLAPVRWPHRAGPVLAVLTLSNKTPSGVPFTAHDERLLDAVTVHLGHSLSKLGPELALDEDRVPRAVPRWKLGQPLRLCVFGAANVALERKRTFLGYSCAKTLAVQVRVTPSTFPMQLRSSLILHVHVIPTCLGDSRFVPLSLPNTVANRWNCTMARHCWRPQ